MGEQLTTARVATARITALATASEQFEEGLIDLDHFLDAVIRLSTDLTEGVTKLTSGTLYKVARRERDKIKGQLDHYLRTTARLDEPEVIKITMQGYRERIKKLE